MSSTSTLDRSPRFGSGVVSRPVVAGCGQVGLHKTGLSGVAQLGFAAANLSRR